MSRELPPDLLSLRVAKAVAGMDYASIPPDVSERACHLMLDALGVGLAASAAGKCDAMIEAFADSDCPGRHAVIGSSAGFSARDAACINGMLMHSLEFDDTHMEAVLHVSSVVLPVVMALGVQTSASGREAIAAYVAGAEVAAAIGMVAKGGFQRRGFHPTSVVGTFAASMTAGRLLKLSVEQLVEAQGIALSLASGSMQFLDDGGHMKSFHPGWAAQAGMAAALMAAKGITGVPQAYEGRHGLTSIFLGVDASSTSLGALIERLGSEWEVPRIAVKPFPAAYYTHACIEAALELGQYDNFDLAKVESITACVPSEVVGKISEPIEAKRRPQTVSAAQFALPFLVATAFVRRKFSLQELTTDVLNDPAIQRVAARVSCEGVSGTSYPALYPGTLVVRLSDGQSFTKAVDANLGSPSRPIGSKLILQKFADNIALTFFAPKADQIVETVINLEGRGQLNDLCDLLRVAVPAPEPALA